MRIFNKEPEPEVHIIEKEVVKNIVGNHYYVIYEFGKLVGVLSETGWNMYLSAIPAIRWTDWKFDQAAPYQKVAEGFQEGRSTPVIRVVKMILDALVF